MPDNPNNPLSFWQELKRRKVLRVITVYAAVAFVILQLVEILAPSLRLPDWTMNFVLVILIVGFIIAIILSWIYDIHPEGGIVKTEPAQRVKAEDITKSSNTWKIASYISFVVIVGLIALNLFGGKGHVRIDESLAKSIAVLPFHNLSGDNAQEYISDGLTDEIISQLFKVRSFEKVVSFSSTMNYKGSQRNIPKIADELGVNYLLEGSFKRIGDQMRVTAQLIDPRSDKHIWLHDYDLPYTEIVGIPAEIALQIADHLKAYITGSEMQKIQSLPTHSSEALELYQMGRFFWNKRTREGLEEAIQYFERAIETDPGYALAYAGLADTYYILANNRHIEEQQGRDKAVELASNALELDRNLSEAYTVLGSLYHTLDWDWDKAENAFQRALESNPSNSTAYQYYAEYLSTVGRHADARIHIDKAVELDPLSFVIRYINARTYYHQGYFKEALRELDICDDIQANHRWTNRYKFRIYYHLGQEDKAFQVLRENILDGSRYDLNVAEQIYQESGINAVLLWKIEIDVAMLEENKGYYQLASTLALLEKYEEALFWLEKAFHIHHNSLNMMSYNIHFRNLHDDPRYTAILEGMGLGEYKPF